jgi:microsomal dipeptidase-like Zn-dependent dipeptidase
MTSVRQALDSFRDQAGTISLTKVIGAQSVGRPVSVRRLCLRLGPGGGGLLARLGGKYARLANQHDLSAETLVGLVDLHTHPAAHLGFGTELFYGAPDGDPGHDFNNCNGFHGLPGLDNLEGNLVRKLIVDKLEGQDYPQATDHVYDGWPGFPSWPAWHSRLHQQMRVDMLQRAWQGGLRLIVALAVNSHTLARIAETRGPYDDRSAGDAQIAAIKALAGGQSFMEVAYSPADVRRIVGDGRLAVVIGVELDCIGNFYLARDTDHASAPFQPTPSDDDIRTEINRLYAAGVRYFFPIHLIDNLFGGTALYEMLFDTASRYQFGSFYAAEPAPATSKIDWTLDQPKTFDLGPQILSLTHLGFDPEGYPPPPPTSTGHRNSRGLQPQGQVALDALMKLGALIDIDHMGEKTVFDTLAHTRAARYPLFAGHNGIRTPPHGNERAHLITVANEILTRGGMYGAGIKGGLDSVQQTMTLIRQSTASGGIAFGSDCSGLEQLPGPQDGPVTYRDAPGAPPDALLRCQLGVRFEDINTTGFSHVGMYPDFLESAVSSGKLTDGQVTDLLNGPEAVATAWEACLRIASQL